MDSKAVGLYLTGFFAFAAVLVWLFFEYGQDQAAVVAGLSTLFVILWYRYVR